MHWLGGPTPPVRHPQPVCAVTVIKLIGTHVPFANSAGDVPLTVSREAVSTSVCGGNDPKPANPEVKRTSTRPLVRWQ
jgi:hypothetical protein